MTLHLTDYQFHTEGDHLVSKLFAHRRAKLPAKCRCNYDREAKHKTIERYEVPKKNTAVAVNNERQYVDALQEVAQLTDINNQNPLEKLEVIDKPLTIKEDQERKQVVNMIRETPPKCIPQHIC